MDHLKGIFPALITPFDEQGKVNEKALEQIIRLHLSQGVKGFYITGSTAECHLLTLEERMRVAEIARQLTKGKAIIIEHIGSMSTDFSAMLARHAADIGVDALSAIPPFFYKYSFDEILSHYETILAQTDLPMIIYNFPALTGVHFSIAEYERFAQNSKIAGVKYTSLDLCNLLQIKTHVPRFTVYNGHDETLLGGLSMGADGAIGSTYNFYYPEIAKLAAHFQERDLESALLVQKELNGILETMIPIGNLQSTKYLMRRYDIDCGGCRMPMKGLTDENKKCLDQLIQERLS